MSHSFSFFGIKEYTIKQGDLFVVLFGDLFVVLYTIL